MGVFSILEKKIEHSPNYLCPPTTWRVLMHPLGYAYHVLQITALIQQEVRYDRKHVGFTVRLAFFFFLLYLDL